MDHAHALLERMRLDVGQVFDSLYARPLRVLDLFSGIGGFSLGFERAGMQTVGFCEIDPYARAVLAKHWPGVPCHDDVKTLDIRSGIDVVCGGFPCQDISVAGRNAGIDGPRSGLWRDMLRIVETIRPQWVVIENVPALRARGLDQVLGALAALGYDAEWHCIPAAAIGAPHRRDRVWVVAYPDIDVGQPWGPCDAAEGPRGRHFDRSGIGAHVAYPVRDRSQGAEPAEPAPGVGRRSSDPGAAVVAYPDQPGLEGWRRPLLPQRAGQCAAGEGGAHVAYAGQPDGCGRLAWAGRGCRSAPDAAAECGRGNGEIDGQWLAEPCVGRVAHGVPRRVDRLKALGNAIVPQIAELIGRAIVEKHALLETK
jgi:DNA (cytosine-5)-methyltransferase 1